MKTTRSTTGLWRAVACAAALTIAQAAMPAQAAQADIGQPQNVMSLTASASAELANDVLRITLNTTKEGQDAASVQAALRQAVDAALAEARKSAEPGQMEVRTGNFSLYPRYSQQGRMSGWNGTAELVLEGKDMLRIAQAAGRIQTLSVAQVVQGLSREARQKLEGEATGRAIASYRAKALDYAKQFGFGGYTLREVSVSAQEPGGPPMPVMRAKAMMAEDASLPIEVGKGTVIVTVSGSVVLQ